MKNEKIKITKKAAIKNAGYTYEELAQELGVSKKTICNWVNGTIPKRVYLMGFCYACGIRIEDLRDEVH